MSTTVWKNPFKFTATKPAYQTLWSKIEKSYTTSIENYTSLSIQLAIMQYALQNSWEELRKVTASKNLLLRVVGDTPGPEPVDHSRLKRFSRHLAAPASVPHSLYIGLLAIPNLTARKILVSPGLSEPDLIDDNVALTQEGVAYRVINPQETLMSFSQYVAIDPTLPKITIESHTELDDTLLHAIFDGIEALGEFVLEKK